MTILAQHGWGKSDKIQRGIANGSIQGVIMSPRDETPANLASFLSEIHDDFPNTERLVDPQLYVGTIWPVRDGKLPDYEYYRQRLTPISFSVAEVQRFVRLTLNWQSGLDVSAVVSPTVMVDDLNSQWAQIAMMFAQETIAQHDRTKPLLISLVVSEDALRYRSLVDNWLDDLTQLDVDGFYIVVRRASETYRQNYDPDVLSSLLWICYSLAEINQYHVFSGYTDMVTLLLHAVGVTGTAAGWYGTLKQFTLRRFQPVSGGRQALDRYSSRPLLNSIYMTELDGIYSGGGVTRVLSGTSFDAQFNGPPNPENVPWPLSVSALHHWHVLADTSTSLTGNTLGDRLDSAHTQIARALALYTQMATLVTFATETGQTHLEQWLDGLERFRVDVGV